MLVIDDAKAKLLKMKERLLQVSNNENVLNEYKALAQELDHDVYQDFVNKIVNTNYDDFPLEEQLRLLNDIIDEYGNFVELQCEYKNVYENYAHEELELSDLNNIYVDNIRKRISDIEGYLYNLNYLENGKKQLDKLNLELIDADKKREYALDKFEFLEDELFNNFINAEGRINVGDNEIGYTSVISEYKENGIDVKALFENESELDRAIDEADKVRQANEEKLAAAEICYQSVPSEENKDIYNSISNDLARANYLLFLYRMAAIVAKKTDNYYEMIEKRKQLKYLNIARINCLSNLGISFVIDPFTRLKINDQLRTLETFEYDPEEIPVLRKKISNLTEVIEERTEKDKEFRKALEETNEFVKKPEEEIKEDLVPISEPADMQKTILGNQVVATNDFLYPDVIDRIKEKANGVVVRVNALFNAKEETPVDKNPELVLEESDASDLVDESLFEDDNVSNEIDESLFAYEPEGNKEPLFNDNGIKEDMDEKLFTSEEDIHEEIDDSVFQEVKPFEDVSLFTNRYDDDIFGESKKEEAKPEEQLIATKIPVEEEPTMPDAFWVTQEDTDTNADNSELSFDEQVEALVGENKVKKLVA